MGAALLAGLLAAGAMLALSLQRVLPNADFAYMSIGTAMLLDGQLLATPYFPPGYPLLLRAVLYFGATALSAGVVLSAIGTGLTAAAVAYTARLWQVPAAPAFMLGLLAASLPDVVLIGLNPHLDALYTGLGAVLLASAMHALTQRPGPWVYTAGLAATLLLLSLRYHAVLLVFPLALVLALRGRPGTRAFGAALLATALLGSSAVYYALYETTGSLRTAAQVQLAAGAEYRRSGSESEATARMYDDYTAWLDQRPEVTPAVLLEGVAANWPQFLTGLAILGGTALWLLGLAVTRRQQPGALWLALFIVGYTLALSPTYFTSRAAALPSVAGVLLACAGLSVLLARPVSDGRRRRGTAEQNAAVQAFAGFLVSLVCLAGIGWNAWRERPILDALHGERRAVLEANRRAADLAGARRSIYGPFDRTGPGLGGLNLPAVSWTRLWLDDPAVAPLIEPYAPKLAPEEALADRRIRAVLLWPSDYPQARRALELLESGGWVEVESGAAGVRLWRRP